MSKAKKRMYAEKYYDLAEDEMQVIINKAKAGDQKSQEELIEIFSNFLSKYVALIYDNKYSLQDYDVRRFIALFVKDPESRRKLMRRQFTHKVRTTISDTMRGINYMVKRYNTHEDIEQTVNMTFLQAVERYERMASKAGGFVPFSGFLYSYYFYLLKKNVDQLLIDQLGRRTFPLVTNGSSDSEHSETDSEKMWDKDATLSQPADALMFGQQIDGNWVIGETATTPFDRLTIQERQLLKWRYIDNLKASEVADRITEHPNTIRDHYQRIRNKLRDHFEEYNT